MLFHDIGKALTPVAVQEPRPYRVRRPALHDMNYPAASCGVSEERHENYRKGVTPECFYRGSTCAHHRSTQRLSTGDPEPRRMGQGVQIRFRLDSRLKHAGMTVFGEEIILSQQAAGN